MPEPVSSRVQAILDAVERTAARHVDAGSGAEAAVPPQPTLPVAPAPIRPSGEPEPHAVPSVATERLLALVAETVAAIDSTEARLAELRREIEVLSQPAPKADAVDVVDLLARVPPGALLPPTAADILRAAGHERDPLVGSDPRGRPAPAGSALSPAARPLPPKGAARRMPPDPDPPAIPVENLNSTARLVAIEMAVSGSTRLQVEKRLHDEFGIADTRPIVDDVFGPDTAPGTRMPWGRRP